MFDDDIFDDFFFDKRKRRKFFFDVFDEMERMDKLFDEIFKKSLKDLEKMKPGKSYVYGFSMKIGPDGKPIIQEFGNFKPEDEEFKVRDEREPITDIIDHGNEISIIAELPGVEEKDIQVKLGKGNLEILVPGKFYKKIKIKSKVDEKSLQWRFKNGVLEINVRKA